MTRAIQIGLAFKQVPLLHRYVGPCNMYCARYNNAPRLAVAGTMDFIFMLTRNDRTVEDALDLLALIRPLGLRHIGFKDVGVSPNVLERVAKTITKAGAISYMEVVSTTPETCLASAKLGR